MSSIDQFDADFGGSSYSAAELKLFQDESPIPLIDQYINMMNGIITDFKQLSTQKEVEEVQEKLKTAKHPVLRLTMNSVIFAYFRFVRRNPSLAWSHAVKSVMEIKPKAALKLPKDVHETFPPIVFCTTMLIAEIIRLREYNHPKFDQVALMELAIALAKIGMKFGRRPHMDLRGLEQLRDRCVTSNATESIDFAKNKAQYYIDEVIKKYVVGGKVTDVGVTDLVGISEIVKFDQRLNIFEWEAAFYSIAPYVKPLILEKSDPSLAWRVIELLAYWAIRPMREENSRVLTFTSVDPKRPSAPSPRIDPSPNGEPINGFPKLRKLLWAALVFLIAQSESVPHEFVMMELLLNLDVVPDVAGPKDDLETAALLEFSCNYYIRGYCFNFRKHYRKRIDGSRVCGGCHQARYCSPECQKADWIFHKKVCKRFPTITDSTQYLKVVRFPDVSKYVAEWLDFLATEGRAHAETNRIIGSVTIY